jgi:acyl-CoA thioester hydrolase
MTKLPPAQREDYAHLSPITIRWMDIDVYGHVNNVNYYSYFDTAVNRYLIEAGVLNPQHSDVIGLVVQTQCNYLAPLHFPGNVEAGIRVAHIGRSSVRYEIGLFETGQTTAAAMGYFIHVYVDAKTRRPVDTLPDTLLAVLKPLQR